MKQNYVTKKKTIDDNNIEHLSVNTENKILNPICMLGQNNTRLTLKLSAESKMTPKSMTIVCM